MVIAGPRLCLGCGYKQGNGWGPMLHACFVSGHVRVLTEPSLNTQLRFILCINFTLGGCSVTERGKNVECNLAQEP